MFAAIFGGFGRQLDRLTGALGGCSLLGSHAGVVTAVDLVQDLAVIRRKVVLVAWVEIL